MWPFHSQTKPSIAVLPFENMSGDDCSRLSGQKHAIHCRGYFGGMGVPFAK
jgi:hypothetical protein